MNVELLTPKEKAEQLVKSFAGWTTSVTASMTIRSAKACAKIHISEFLKFFNDNMNQVLKIKEKDLIEKNILIDMDAVIFNREMVEYYKNVLEEIEKIK